MDANQFENVIRDLLRPAAIVMLAIPVIGVYAAACRRHGHIGLHRVRVSELAPAWRWGVRACLLLGFALFAASVRWPAG